MVRQFDQGQASLLYLPVVIVCAMRFGFGPAIAAAFFSFICWDWFFLPPFHTFNVEHPKDFISLIVFVIAASITARLAAEARQQTNEARTRLQEMTTLFQASDALSQEVSAPEALRTLAQQLQTLCDATGLIIFRSSPDKSQLAVAGEIQADESDFRPSRDVIDKIAQASYEHDRTIGLSEAPRLWAKAVAQSAGIEIDANTVGVYIPLRAADQRVGVLHVSSRRDGQPFTPLQENLIQTLANHAAAVIARDLLADQAAQAAALKEADALKDALLSLVSHELRTPLSAIKASASGLLQAGSTWDEAGRREALQSIDSESDRLAGIVSNLLDLSRLEAGAWLPLKDWCDMSDVVDTALSRLAVDDAGRVRVSVDADVPLIRIDHAQMALVVENLLRNAVKYAPGDTPIDVAVGVDEGNMVLSVRDYGDGIDPADIDHVFERFYRSVKHRSSSVHGTGIGLALCKAVVDAHGGTLTAKSPPVDGSSGALFVVRLPISETGDTVGST